MHVRPTIALRFAGPDALLAAFFHHGNTSGLFVAGNTHVEVGAEVQIEVALEARTIPFRGRVNWKRLSDRPGLPAGLGVGFLPSERSTRDLLLHLAQGREVKLVHRRSERRPIEIAIEYRTGSSFLADVTDDLSSDGAFIATDQDLSVGTELELRLRVPGRFFALKLRGRVRWVQKDGRLGLGVQFLFDSARAREKLTRAIAAIEARVARDLAIQNVPATSVGPRR
jgi:uncharacterized protein (TIGR02266 family)